MALLAIQAAGAAYVPLDPSGPALRLRQIVADLRPALAVAVASLRDRAAEVVAGACPVVSAAERPEPGRAQAPIGGPEVGDVAYVIFTSGSTGPPKGVAVTHGNVRALARARREVYGTARPTILLTWPLVFDGSVAVMQWAFDLAGTLVIASDEQVRDVHDLADLIEAHGVTHLSMVPSLYSALLDARPNAIARLQVVVLAGEALPAELARRHHRLVPRVRLVNEYGPTECTVWSTYHEVGPADGDGVSVPIGRPIPGVHVHIVDEHGELVDGQTEGELVIGGDTVASGYLGDSGLTRRRFRPDRWCGAGRTYLTGDLVTEAADGLLRFAGRKDDQVKINGHRVEPGEIEAALLGHPSVLAAAVIASTLTDDRRALVGYVRLRAGDDVPADRLVDYLRERVSGYMIPRQVIALDRLPTTAAGKIDRQTLAARQDVGAWPVTTQAGDQAEPPDGPSGDLELLIATAWAKTTGAAGIQPTTNFFDSGGDSVRLAALQALLAGHDVKVRVKDMFAHPSPRDLAAWLGGTGRDARAASEVTERGKLMRQLLAGRRGGRQAR